MPPPSKLGSTDLQSPHLAKVKSYAIYLTIYIESFLSLTAFVAYFTLFAIFNTDRLILKTLAVNSLSYIPSIMTFSISTFNPLHPSRDSTGLGGVSGGVLLKLDPISAPWINRLNQLENVLRRYLRWSCKYTFILHIQIIILLLY